VIGELKLTFNLELILQAVEPAAAADESLARGETVRPGQGPRERRALSQSRRRLGFGMLAVTIPASPGDRQPPTRPLAAPQEAPRWSRGASAAQGRSGDGWFTRAPIMTPIAQALACVRALGRARRVKDLRPENSRRGQNSAAQCYGWFARAERGVCYDRLPGGRAETLAAATDGPQRRKFSALTRTTKKTGGWHDRGYRQLTARRTVLTKSAN